MRELNIAHQAGGARKGLVELVLMILTGDARKVLAELPAHSVQCCVTSPPYFGLRDYDTEPLIWGGGDGCEHEWRGNFGNEPDVNSYVAHSIEILRAVKRVLRKDGLCFWNVADSRASGKGSCHNPGGGDHSLGQARKKAGAHPLERGNISALKESGLKPKDLCLIPQRIAIAAQEDGWYVVSDIISDKPNPMPE